MQTKREKNTHERKKKKTEKKTKERKRRTSFNLQNFYKEKILNKPHYQTRIEAKNTHQKTSKNNHQI